MFYTRLFLHFYLYKFRHLYGVSAQVRSIIISLIHTHIRPSVVHILTRLSLEIRSHIMQNRLFTCSEKLQAYLKLTSTTW